MTKEVSRDDAASTLRLGAARIFRISQANFGPYLRLPAIGTKGLALIVAVLLIAWATTGFYKVQPDEQGVVLRFGRWTGTEMPGLHYHLPYPIETVLLPKTTNVNELRVGKAHGGTGVAAANQMLTGDENIVEAEYSVLWKVRDAGQYLFRNAEPDETLRTAAESVMREVIGRNPIQSALSDRRQQIADEAREALQRLLDSYEAGIVVTQIQLQRVDPPATVIDAFNDVQRARADQERARNEAEAYSNDILPRARGEAERIKQEAEAYKTKVIDLAQGETSSFLAVYEIYKRAPGVTSWRLYLDSMDEMLRSAGKVIIDSSGKGVSSVVPYMSVTENKLPLLGAPLPPRSGGEK